MLTHLTFDLQPVKKLEIDHFSLVSHGGYADIYKSKTNILCNDGLMRQASVQWPTHCGNHAEHFTSLG